jgi:hypothetical protein
MRQLVWSLEHSGRRRQAFIEDLGVSGFELLIVGAGGLEIWRAQFASWALAEDRATLEHGRLISHGWTLTNETS